VKIVYEIKWHEIDEVFSHCTIEPVTFLSWDSTRRGLSRLKNKDGVIFQSYLGRPYHASEEEALEAIKDDMRENIEHYEDELAKLQVRLQAYRNYLEKLEINRETL
jgi:hypothetical protein